LSARRIYELFVTHRRAHRKSIFNLKFKLFGVACGKSEKNESVCVAEFANTFRESNMPAGVIQVQ